MTETEITVTLTREEAEALLGAWLIAEYGSEHEQFDPLLSAEGKLKKALHWGPVTP